MDYYLIPNTLAGDGSYIARVVTGKIYTLQDLIDLMLSERNVLSRPDLEAAMTALEEAIVKIVRKGHSIHLPWVSFGYGMKGHFETIGTKRNPDDHPLELNFRAGSRLADAVAAVELRRIHAPDFGARIIRFIDYQSQTSNAKLTPGGMFEIIGERLRVAGDQPGEVGLYLRDRNLKETEVTALLKNEPTVINGSLPADLAPGVYQVVIRTQVGTSGNRFLKEVRTSISDIDLTVE